jgi:hypothetical protein
VCDNLGVPRERVWGNHDGLLLSPDLLASLDAATKLRLGIDKVLPGDWAIAEALAQGSVATPMSQYEKDLASGHLEVRILEILPRFEGDDIYKVMRQAAWNWTQDVEGRGYDYLAYAGLILRTFLDWEVSTGSRTKFWCTEGGAKGYLINPPNYDLLQDTTPTPMHVEQISGMIPRPNGRIKTLRDITSRVMA